MCDLLLSKKIYKCITNTANVTWQNTVLQEHIFYSKLPWTKMTTYVANYAVGFQE